MKKLQQELLELCGMKLHETEWEAYTEWRNKHHF